ncbi:MAG: flagellar protein FlgN [Desulfobacteraceae bacterium]|nr:flagellar protein FlgN [Desulfobacteraceae bacterium]
MNETIRVIIRNFEDQVAIYEKLLACLNNEKEAVIAADVTAVDAAVAVKEKLVEDLHALDAAQHDNFRAVSEQSGILPDALTLKKLAALTANPQKKTLTDIRDKLAMLAKKVQEKSRANRTLLTHCLGLVNSTFGLMDQSFQQSPVYYRSGEMKDDNRGGMLVSGTI